MKDQVQFKMNLPADVKAWLEREAARNFRSQGAEVTAGLRERMERQEAATA